MEDRDIDKILISIIVSSGGKNYKYFIGHKDNDYQTNPLHIIISKTNVYVERYNSETN